jgi:hypothetical protein
LQDDESINKIIPASSPTTTTPTAEVVVAVEVQVTDADNRTEQQLEPEEAIVSVEERGSENRGHERPYSLEMFDLLTRLQSSRLDDQRCPMPSSPLTPAQSTQQQQHQPLPHQQNTILRSEAKTRCF